VSRSLCVCALALLAAAVSAGAASAESGLRLPPQEALGAIPASTYDEETSKRLGDAKIELARLPSGNVLMIASGSIQGAEAISLAAELEKTPDGAAMRPVWQQSHSWDAQGRTQGIMWIDHAKHRALCTPAEQENEPTFEVQLDQPDLVANVPMHLLFLPLVSGAQKEVSFQFLACKAKRAVPAKASVAQRLTPDDGTAPLIEVRSELDLGPVLTPLARAFLPRFSFWFDPTSRSGWVGHRMPMFTGGPEVLVVRTGVPVKDLFITTH
jgi:hypothetical protein